jgi:hypothetical protein
MDGKVIDINFTNYQNPIPSFYSYQALPMELEISPVFITAASGPTVLKVFGKQMFPYHRVLLNGAPLPTRYVSRTELEATIPAEAISEAGMYLVTLKCEGEPVPESHRAHLTVGFRQ